MKINLKYAIIKPTKRITLRSINTALRGYFFIGEKMSEKFQHPLVIGIISPLIVAAVVSIFISLFMVKMHEYKIENSIKRIEVLELSQQEIYKNEIKELKVSIAKIDMQIMNIVENGQRRDKETEKRQSEIMSLLQKTK